MPEKADWFPDPLGSSELRFFNGESWTGHVISGGEQTIDTLDTKALAAPIDLSHLPPPPRNPDSLSLPSSNDLSDLPPPPATAVGIGSPLKSQTEREMRKEAKRLAKEAKLAEKASKQKIASAEAADRSDELAKVNEVSARQSQERAARAAEFKLENDARKKALREYKRASTFFKGVTLTPDCIAYQGKQYPLSGTNASVETAGEINKRSTVTRYVVLGPLAGIAFKKSKDNRELYLTVEGEGFAFVVNLDPEKGLEARKFAAKINAAGMQAKAVAPQQSTPTIGPGLTGQEGPGLAVSSDRDGLVEGLERLHRLFESGALNIEEYELAKLRLISGEI
jgi:hypothetical protein